MWLQPAFKRCFYDLLGFLDKIHGIGRKEEKKEDRREKGGGRRQKGRRGKEKGEGGKGEEKQEGEGATKY